MMYRLSIILKISILKDEQLTPSEGDSLDSEVVRRAIENLGLEEEGLEYKVSIMDFETGINHTVEVSAVLPV